MGRDSRPETAENYEFSKSVKFFWTFSEAKNGLKMTFQAISRAENLHAPSFKPGKQFQNVVRGQEIYFSAIFGPEILINFRKLTSPDPMGVPPP